MIIKELKKHGRTVYVRDRGTEKFEAIGRFLKSDDFKIYLSAGILTTVIFIGCWIGSAIVG